jgi:hypothetical protein
MVSLCDDCSKRQRQAEESERDYKAPHYPVDWNSRWNSETKYNCNANQKELIAKDLEMCKAIKIGDYASTYGGWPRIWQEVLDIAMKVEWPLHQTDVCFLMSGPLGPHWEHWWSITGHKAKEPLTPRPR